LGFGGKPSKTKAEAAASFLFFVKADSITVKGVMSNELIQQNDEPEGNALLRVLIALWFSFGIAGCANVVSPDGGARDQRAPQLVRVTPPDQSLNTRPRRIVFEFDEYIQLKDPQAVRWGNVPAGSFEAQTRLRKLIIRLNPDSLALNSTYGVDLGGSVADITEGNAISSLGYAFSTGTYLDSLQWTGQIRDAQSDLPLRGITIALYPKQVLPALLRGDSIRPERWTVSNDSGFFVFRNLPNTIYTALAFKDPERDLFLGIQLPKAFVTEITPGTVPDSGNPNSGSANAMWFSEDYDAQIDIRSALWSEGGSLVIIFRGSPWPVEARGIQENGLIINGMGREIRGDSLWLHVPPRVGALSTGLKVRLTDQGKLDTLLKIDNKELTARVLNAAGPAVVTLGLSEAGALNLLRWNRPVHLANPLLWCWQSGQGKEIPVENEFLAGGQEGTLRVDFANNDFAPDQWVLRIDSGAFEDGFGRPCRPFVGKINQISDLAAMMLVKDSLVAGWETKEQRVVGLWTLAGKLVASKAFRTQQEAQTPWVVDGLLPGKYKISVLEDRNLNGIWDASSYRKLRQPEILRWLSRDLELKPGWTTELRWR
jgi:hypothetical protein